MQMLPMPSSVWEHDGSTRCEGTEAGLLRFAFDQSNHCSRLQQYPTSLPLGEAMPEGHGLRGKSTMGIGALIVQKAR
eukprot:1153699-Pelagomonas_calceolata.AAC.12